MTVKFNHLFFIAFILITYSCNNDNDQSVSHNVLLENRYGGSKDEEFVSSTLTSDGGQIILARTASIDGDVSGNISYTNPTSNFTNYNIWVLKLNKTGNIEWQKTYGGSNQEIASTIIQTNDGGYLFCGGTGSNDGDIKGNNPSDNLGGESPWIVKISSRGNIEWQYFGNKSDQRVISIVQTADGGFTYCTYNTLVKIDSLGNNLWTSTLDFYPNYMSQLANGDLILTGRNYPQNGEVDYIGIIKKFSSTGAPLQENSFNRCLPTKIAVADDGGFLLIGSTTNINVPNYHSGSGNGNSDAWVAKLNSVGTIEWQKAFGGTLDEIANDIIISGDNYIIGASANSSNGDLETNFGFTDYCIFKINNAGTLNWQKVYGGTYRDILGNIFKSPNGNLILTGMSESNKKSTDIDTDIWILNIRE